MYCQKDLINFLNELKEKQLTPEQEEGIIREYTGPQEHHLTPRTEKIDPGFYEWNDFSLFQPQISYSPLMSLKRLEDLLKRDEQREKDGFPRKIKIGHITRPIGKGKNKVVVVPSTTEDKLIHDNSVDMMTGEGGDSGGVGDGEEGEIIGETPLYPEGEGAGGPGGDGSGEHDVESDTYNLGKIISERFKLPNLKNKGRKKALKKYTYDLTDLNRGSGQKLDLNRTLKKIIETNIALGRIKDTSNINPADLLVDPKDKIYRVLSRELDYESQALVFLARDYSGSMSGKPTQVVVTQHIFIHAWLTFEYQKLIKERFIVHDTEAKEVPDYDTYVRYSTAGGTNVACAFELINKIVEEENLARDYNIYVCYGTDGDDWDRAGDKAINELNKMLMYVNRIGISIVENSWGGGGKTYVEEYLADSGVLDLFPDLIRMDVMDEDADENRIVEGIKRLFSEGKYE